LLECLTRPTGKRLNHERRKDEIQTHISFLIFVSFVFFVVKNFSSSPRLAYSAD